MTDAIDCLEGYLKGRGDKMKAEDTIMGRRCVVNKEPALGGYILWIAGVGRVGFCPLEKDAKKYAKEITSALEISFKAGIDEAQNRLHTREVLQITEAALREQKLAGIKEVVEEYKVLRACTHIVGYHYLRDCKECEEAKLKEWGI